MSSYFPSRDDDTIIDALIHLILQHPIQGSRPRQTLTTSNYYYYIAIGRNTTTTRLQIKNVYTGNATPIRTN